jgi:hypothetical protein
VYTKGMSQLSFTDNNLKNNIKKCMNKSYETSIIDK